MAYYFVSYDLRTKRRAYDAVHESIKHLGEATRVLESAWVLNTNGDVHDILGALLRDDEEQNDGFIVVAISKPWGGVRLSNEDNLAAWLGEPSPIRE